MQQRRKVSAHDRHAPLPTDWRRGLPHEGGRAQLQGSSVGRAPSRLAEEGEGWVLPLQPCSSANSFPIC
eukprot:366318-Chlamydomonas_euryale.AAC.12